MVSPESIDALYESTLRPRLAALEGLRLSVRGYAIRGGLLVGVPAVLLFLNPLIESLLPDGLGWLATVGPFIGVLAGLLVVAFKYLLPGLAAYGNYRTRFKHEVAAEVFKIVCPSAAYAPHDGIQQDIFDEPGLFNTRGGYSTDDLVRGRIGETPFEAAEASRSYSTGGKNSTNVVVFKGLFFHIDFNKRLRGVTIVDPANASYSTTGDRSALTRVTLEDAAFDAAFTVHTSDEVEARYILTPAMMARILALSTQAGHPVHLAFKNHRVYIGVNYQRALFEPNIAGTTSVSALHEMAAQFALAEAIVQELDLDTRIWTKDVDDSLLAPQPAEAPNPLADAMRSGTLTAEQLWDVAMKASEGDRAGVPESAPRPASTSVVIEHQGGDVVVRYGLGFGFWMAVVIWAASTAVALAAYREIPAAAGLREWAPLVGWIPLIPYASAIAATQPVVWGIVATVIAPVAFLMWAVRVRAVSIGPDAVRIWRGLRPWPRRYPRPEYGKVVRVETAVYIGRTQGLNLINASASPMLSDDEAPWVAVEMQRALRSTAR